MTAVNLRQFVADYLATAAWVMADSPDECTEFTPIARQQAENDCVSFIERVIEAFGKETGERLLTTPGSDLGYLAAHDFWLTRNHHGAGFWDKGDRYGEAESLELTEIAQKFKEVNCIHLRGKKSKLIFD